jgi:hypothetical protein
MVNKIYIYIYIYTPRDNLECRNLSEVKIMWRDSILARKKTAHHVKRATFKI